MTRARLASVVLAVLLVTVAAIGHRLATTISDVELVRAPLDRATAYDGGRVVVSDVRVGTTVRDGDDELTTRGLFVVVNVAVRSAGREKARVASSRLRADGGVTYLPASTLGTSVDAEAGFETARDLVYEVDPARIDDLTLELWDQGIVYRYFQRTQTPLGITAANAQQWLEAGAGRTVSASPDDVTKALS